MRGRRIAGLAITAIYAALGGSAACDQSGTVGATVDAGSLPDVTTDVAVDVPMVPDADAADDGGFDAGTIAITDVTITPNPNNVLSATLTFNTAVPTNDVVSFQNTTTGNGLNKLTLPVNATPRTAHTVNLLGMRASSSFAVTISVTATDGSTGAALATYATPALPSNLPLPTVTTVLNDPNATSPGWTLMPVWYWTGMPFANISGSKSSIVILDSEFQIVWYYFTSLPSQLDAGFPSPSPNMPFKLPNGDIAFVVGGSGWAEIDMMGNMKQLHNVSEFGGSILALHHELSEEVLGGNLVSLAPQLKVISGYPGGKGALTYNVVGSQIVELGLDGGLLNSWSEFDMLDPYYEGNPNLFNANFWNYLYPNADGGTKDWTHDNAVSQDPNDNSYIVSSRTLSYVYKFRGLPGMPPQLIWKIGFGAGWPLTNQGETWFWNQHAAHAMLGSDHILMFDDGLSRLEGSATCGFSGSLEPCYSRALELQVNPGSKDVTIVWQYRGDTPFYSADLGSAYMTTNGDVLVNSGGEICQGACVADGGVANAFGGQQGSAQDLKHSDVFEVTHTTPPVTVAHFAITVPFGAFPDDPTFSGMSTYRATRITSLY